MKLRISIGMDNAAFSEAPGFEVSRLLRVLADKVRCDDSRAAMCGASTPIFDINGNRVGEMKVSK
jgi:hypothetical protein